MSTTFIGTSPAWIFKVLSEEKQSDFIKQKLFGDYKAFGNMDHTCAAEKSYALLHNAPLPPPSSPPSARPLSVSFPAMPATSDNLFATLADKIIPQLNTATTEQTHHSATANPKLDYFCELLTRIREPIVLYEEQKGVPRDIQYSFMGLMTTLAHQTYNAVFTIFTMLINLIPLAEGFLQMLRFIIDKSIDICVTRNKKDKAFKLIIFAGELVIMFFSAIIIMGLIFIPVLNLITYAFFKLWAIVLPH